MPKSRYKLENQSWGDVNEKEKKMRNKKRKICKAIRGAKKDNKNTIFNITFTLFLALVVPYFSFFNFY